MKLLPIVPGCKAVIIWSYAGNQGKEVNVIRFIGEHIERIIGVDGKFYEFHEFDVWETEEVIMSTAGIGSNFISGSQLMRIDGYQENISQEQKEMDNVS